MRKLFLTLVMLTVFGFVQAQTFKFSVGYAVPWISQQIGVNSSSTSVTTFNSNTGAQSSESKSTHRDVRGSYGAGLTLSGSFGYRFSQHVGIELGLAYLQGKKINTTSTYSDTQSDVLKNAGSESETSFSKGVFFTPSLKFIASERKLTPYMLIGPVVGKVKFNREMNRTLEEDGLQSSEYRYTKYSGGLSLGIRGGVGVTLKVNSKVSLFSEVIFTGMNYYPKQSEISRYTINGEEKLSTLTTHVRETIYQKKVVFNSNEVDDAINYPGKSVRFPVAMSSITTSAGVYINLQ